MSSAFYMGRYNCLEEIGSGPLGETFRAKIYGVAGFEKSFALKRIHNELCNDPAFVARFVKASTAAAALAHERITAIHEVGAQGTRYFVAADLVRGLDVGQLVAGLKTRDEAITADAALTLALDILDGLTYAHGRKDLLPNGVLHLGLSPRSVLLTAEGDAKLVDVGLFPALAVPGWANDARAATLAWVAPEVADGAAADGRADVFSVGAVLHLVLSGSSPFAANNAVEVRKRQAKGPPPPPACEGRIQQALQKALQPDPAERFPSVEAFAEVLRPIFSSRAVRARGDLAMLVRRLSGPTTAPQPPGPVLEDAPTKNTFAGVGTGDAVPVQKVVLPGPETENMKAVDAHAVTEAHPIIPALPLTQEVAAIPELEAEPDPPSPPPFPLATTPPSTPASAIPPPAPEATPAAIAPANPLLVPPEGGRADPDPIRPVLPVLPSTARVTAFPEPPASPQRRRWVIIGSAALVAVAGAGLWITFGNDSPPPPPPKEEPKLPAITQREKPAPSPVAEVKPEPKPEVKVEPKPAATDGPALLKISSVPDGAQLFVDGESRGTLPQSLSLSPGKHKLVAVAEKSKLHQQELVVSGPTDLQLQLEPAKTSGTAGLKVRCKSKGELRILVDGTDTGLSCPNEARINVSPGEHTVGLYSPKTDKTIEVKATVKDDANHSTRLYLSY